MKENVNNSSENAGVVHNLLIFCFIGLPKCYVFPCFDFSRTRDFQHSSSQPWILQWSAKIGYSPASKIKVSI